MEIEPRIFVQSRTPMGKKIQGTKKVRGPDSPLYTSICPLVYVIRIFGLAPYEFNEDVLVPSSTNSIYAYVCFAVYTYIIYTILLRFMAIEMEKPLLGHTETVKAISNYLMAIFDIFTTLLSRKKFVTVWNVIQDYDEIVKNLGFTRIETRTCLWTWVIGTIHFVTWLTVNQLGMWAFAEPWFDNVSYMLVYVATSISITKFSGVAMLLGQRFEHLNNMSKKSGPTASRWLLASPKADMKDIEYLHNLLMVASENLNSLYSWSLLLWLGNLSLHIVSDYYFLIQRLMAFPWTHDKMKLLACLSAWIVTFSTQLVLLNYACDFASDEANCLGYIMINWRRWLNNSGIFRDRNDSIEMSIHLINRRLNFSAAGCFYVNMPLLRTITALLSTYLVILLQFPE